MKILTKTLAKRIKQYTEWTKWIYKCKDDLTLENQTMSPIRLTDSR